MYNISCSFPFEMLYGWIKSKINSTGSFQYQPYTYESRVFDFELR
jgi:hypothetical protein